MGTFPPAPNRWSMDFYYPNCQNDFWRIMGLIFFDNKQRFYDELTRTYRLDDIKRLLTERGIALNDTGAEIIRTKGNASDKFLEIVRPVNLRGLLDLMPECHTVATTGEKAASVIAALTSTPLPKMGEMVTSADGLNIWRMPSTSRAYPMAIEKKAEYYTALFRSAGIL
jgi:G:T/U mismatch-specific DNA glycosylase